MIKFTKMHGLGNDYVYMDAIHQKIENITTLAKFVSNRHFGIGSDGLILICESKVADFKMRMFNSDGSEAEMCGNGIRCVGKFVYDKGLTTKQIVTIETLAGIKTLNLNTKDGKVQTARVDMGEPILEASKIPVISEEMPVQNLKLKAIDKEFTFTCVSMGNPHAITVVENVKEFDARMRRMPSATTRICWSIHITARTSPRWTPSRWSWSFRRTTSAASRRACYLSCHSISTMDIRLSRQKSSAPRRRRSSVWSRRSSARA